MTKGFVEHDRGSHSIRRNTPTLGLLEHHLRINKHSTIFGVNTNGFVVDTRFFDEGRQGRHFRRSISPRRSKVICKGLRLLSSRLKLRTERLRVAHRCLGFNNSRLSRELRIRLRTLTDLVKSLNSALYTSGGDTNSLPPDKALEEGLNHIVAKILGELTRDTCFGQSSDKLLQGFGCTFNRAVLNPRSCHTSQQLFLKSFNKSGAP